MDFVEKLFGISPDGGDGSTELMYIIVLLIAIAGWITLRRFRRGAA
jgi:LPXTG-motif cell wall-anchored protein